MILPIVLMLAQIQQANQPNQLTQMPPSHFQPAKCVEYQHVVHHPAYLTGSSCENGACPAISIWIPEMPDTCEDDIRQVKESDWQALLTRVKKLEADAQKPEGNSGKLRTDSSNDVLAVPDDPCLHTVCGDVGGGLQGSADTVTTHEPYDPTHATAFPSSPTLGQTWHGFRFDGQAWKFIPADTGLAACDHTSHLHALGARFTGPDVKGAKTPPPGDNRCYRDSDDSPVQPRGKKLEAKR